MTNGFASKNGRNKARFSSDPDYLAWRYPMEGIQRFGFLNGRQAHVIVEEGSPKRYLRICQTDFDGLDSPVMPLIAGLMEQARSCRALGVQWTVYDNGRPATAIVKKLRHLGFVCVRRQRKVMIYTRRPELADPSAWSFDDTMFTYE
jgi:hypothetical protein